MASTTTVRRIMPDVVTVVNGGRSAWSAPVERWNILRPVGHGDAPRIGCPILERFYAVEAVTAKGSRWYGFHEAFIGSDLRVHVSGGFADCENARGWEVESSN